MLYQNIRSNESQENKLLSFNKKTIDVIQKNDNIADVSTNISKVND
jgi:hypothetical protein